MNVTPKDGTPIKMTETYFEGTLSNRREARSEAYTTAMRMSD
jgi:hypothetical protein